MRKIIPLLFICVLLNLNLFLLAASVSEEVVVNRPKEEYKGEGLADPFKDVFRAAASISGSEAPVEAKPLPILKVQGIIQGGRFEQAIINNKIVKVGDTINEAVITKIEKHGITVLFDNKTYHLSSPAADILQGAKPKPQGGQQ
ncbi:MAG TPA: hypothetical protein VI976_01270 [Candidatus Omnitrophota bacterium]|nr:hypothetical protein [Candidatus Omnitrophota bacterium]